jgi:SAM-dependent methyltransferase
MAGFDPSPDMLDRCRTRCAEEGFAPELAQARYEDFGFSRTFGAVLVPVGSFTLIDDFAVAMDVLRRFHASLEPGGVLVIDLQGLGFLASNSIDRRRWTAPSGDLLTCEGTRSVTDWFRQRAESVYRYERWRDGRLIETEIDIMAQRFWGLDEFRMALEAAGFCSVSVVGNYDRSRGLRGSDRTWTFEALRA